MAETTTGAERVEQLFAPELFLPEQLDAPRADSLISGERALMLAILEDAIRCAQAPQKSRARAARDAQNWMRSRDQRWPFSFVGSMAANSFAWSKGRLRQRTALFSERANAPPPRAMARDAIKNSVNAVCLAAWRNHNCSVKAMADRGYFGTKVADYH